MNCPICGAAGLQKDCDREKQYTYRGYDTILHPHGDWCPQCDELIMDDMQAAKAENQIREFINSVDNSYPDFILKVRKKLGLSQKDAGELFGGGINAFSRYELGKTVPPLSLIVLLGLLDKHPHLLNELKGADSLP